MFVFLKFWASAALAVGCLMFLTETGFANTRVAALVRSGIEGEDAALVLSLQELLKSEDYQVTEFDCADLCNAGKLNATAISLLVLPDASALPASSMPTVDAYLRGGGDIIALRTPLWQRPLLHFGEQWQTAEEYALASAATTPANLLLDFDPSNPPDLKRNSNTLDAPTQWGCVPNGPAEGVGALHVKIANLTSWETIGAPSLQSPFPEGHTLTVFSAKGGPGTTQLAVEWSEKNNSRWIATIPLTTEWRRYVLKPTDFKLWYDYVSDKPSRPALTPSEAARMSFGLAFTHTTALSQGDHEYWISLFGTAPATGEYQTMADVGRPPALDTLSPTYKFYEMTDVGSIESRSDQIVVSHRRYPVPKVVRSSYARPKGGGFDKNRTWRWIPLLEAVSPSGDWRGVPATLLVHADGEFQGGVWASFSVEDRDWYRSEEVLQTISEVARFMKQDTFILDGGSNFYTYFDKQPMTLGVRATNFSAHSPKTVQARVRVYENSMRGAKVHEKTWHLSMKSGEVCEVSASFTPRRWLKKGYRVTAELLDNEATLDKVTHEAHVWRPKKRKNYITIQDGEFRLKGERWRAHGVNYMPSSGLGIEDGKYFEHYLQRRSYDPEVYIRDLDRVKDMGMNSVSIFIYGDMYKGEANKDHNLLDILRLLEERELYVNLSLRPGDPVNYYDKHPIDQMLRDFVQYYRLAENDMIFAYDLAWEPSFGHHNERKKWDRDWEQWIIERYGSVENAEKDWGFNVPRDEEGAVTNPLPDQVDQDGDYRVMTAAYRRFLDTLLYKKYRYAQQVIESVDPNHYISFRMSEAANPTYRWGGRITYDFPYLAAALGFLSPEAYGRIGTWERAKPGWFVREYALWAAPDKPTLWAEAGVSVWDQARMTQSELRLKVAADAYREFYRLLISSCADGVYYWWYPGGFRFGENSDYGIINPDGTDREVTQVIRKNAKPFLQGASRKPTDFWIEFDRDAYPEGVTGVYETVEETFWKAIEDGYTPGLTTAGTNTNSANCPLLAVGNTPCNGSNPPKYLDGAFDVVEIQNADGKWVHVSKGAKIRVASNKPVRARLTITNLAEAAWITDKTAQKDHGGGGAVSLVVDGGTRIALTKAVPRHGRWTIRNAHLTEKPITKPTELILTFQAEGRTQFGEKFAVRLIP